MRFKVNYNDSVHQVQVYCYKMIDQDFILPIRPEQQVHYPICDKLLKKIHSLLNKEFKLYYPEGHFDELIEMVNRTEVDIKWCRKELNKIRREFNPEIIRICEKFKMDHAEYFI
jgi:hypothetical protein